MASFAPSHASSLSSSKSTAAIFAVPRSRSRSLKLPFHSLAVRSIFSTRSENGPGSVSGSNPRNDSFVKEAAALYSAAKNPLDYLFGALSVNYLLGSLFGRPQLASLLLRQVSNLVFRGTTPLHFGVGAAASIFMMGALIGHKWAAKSGAERPNGGICNRSIYSRDCPTKGLSVIQKKSRKVKQTVNVVNYFKDGVSPWELIQILLLVVVVMLNLN